MADNFTQLNVGEGGDFMDEVAINYSSSPTVRKRPRVVITGPGPDSDAAVTNSDPADDSLGLVTRNVPSKRNYPGDDIVFYSIAAGVPARVETTIGTYIVPTGAKAYVIGFSASGRFAARYTLYIDSGGGDFPLLRGWSTAANLNVQLSFQGITPEVSESMTIRLRVYHEEQGFQNEFTGTILGYII